MVWNLLGGLMPPENDAKSKNNFQDSGAEEEFEILEPEEAKAKERRHSGDSGNCSEAEAEQSTNRAVKLEFQLTQSLLGQVKAGENNRDANSGRQAQRNLERMSFVINKQTIEREYIRELYNKYNHLIPNGSKDYRLFAKRVFTGMFEYAKAEVPNDCILEELITNCNQAGYEFAMYGQIQPILTQYNLTPTIPEKAIGICCNSADSVSVEYSDVIVIKNPDPDQFEQYESGSKLEFTLKFQNGEVEYGNGKVTLTIPEQLKNYKANGKSLLDDINEHFKDADNAVVKRLVNNIGDGPKSFIMDQESLSDDKESSLIIIPKDSVFDLDNIAELVKEAVGAKDVNALGTYIDVIKTGVARMLPEEGLSLIEKIKEIVNEFIDEQGKAWSAYPAMPGVHFVYTAAQCYNGYISQEDYDKVRSLWKDLRETQSILSNNENGKNNNQSNSQKNPKPKSASSQQQEKNTVDKSKNIMNNREASTEQPISNNYKGGEMDGDKKNTKSIEERLSDAIKSINFDMVKHLLGQESTSVDESTLQKLLGQANTRITSLKEGDKKQDQEDRLTKIKELLETRLKSIGAEVAASSTGDSVEDIGATTSDSGTLVNIDDKEASQSVEPKSEDVQPDSPSLSLQSSLGSDYSELGNNNGQSVGECAQTPSDSNGGSSSFEKIDEEEDISVPKSSSLQDTQPGVSPLDISPNVDNVPKAEEPVVIAANIRGVDDQQDSPSPLSLPSDDEQDEVLSISGVGDEEEPLLKEPKPAPVPLAPKPAPALNPVPTPIPTSEPEPTPSLPSKLEDDTQGTDGNPDSAPQSTKGSKRPVIAASALAIAGVALGVAIAVHLEMLAVGIAVGACCLIAAAISTTVRRKAQLKTARSRRLIQRKSLSLYHE